VNHKVTQKKRN